MDEVEDPSLPRAGEASPTIRPVPDTTTADGNPPKDTVKASALLTRDTASPTRTQQRPGLKRESSAPPPPQQPPPPAPPTDGNGGDVLQEAPDSLTLADLRRIRSTFPTAEGLGPEKGKPEVVAEGRCYGFEYRDAQALPVEVEEWFGYGAVELGRLRGCGEVFGEEWGEQKGWTGVTEEERRGFVGRRLEVLGRTEKLEEAVRALQCLVYVALGVWDETAGVDEEEVLEELFPGGEWPGSRLGEYKESGKQIQWIVAGVDTLHASGGLRVVYEVLQTVAERDFTTDFKTYEANARNEAPMRRAEGSVELWCCLTLMYLFVEVARATEGENARQLRSDIAALEPNLLNYLTKVISMLRWEESLPIPLTKMLLLSWKTILATIGGIKDVEHVKSTLREAEADDGVDARGKPIITASPLDYHLFRQEINSKYPAYQPPPALFPLEPENNSILPPLKNRRSSYTTPIDTSLANTAPESIMHQPVHIATPAPSPPPSPAGPGKAGKKQNYQTNQMFPFLYPPLDGSSNDLGGKGNTELQDALVGRKWEGSDIPASIMEAAELFSKRMRATRAMKQLWQVRVEYMKQERGWKNEEQRKEKKEDGWLGKSLKVLEELKELGIDGLEGLEDLELDNEEVEDDFEVVEKPATTIDRTAEQGKPLAPKSDEQRRLDEVENFYRHSLQHLQSVVIVLLKSVLQNVTDIVTKNNGQNGLGLQAGIQFNNDPGMITGSARPVENGAGAADGNLESTAEELDHLRSQEIGAKALSAILLLLLKWFKVNHILQYEFMSQLMMDSNYVPLMLKLWQTQDVGRACHYRLEREELNFFTFCKEGSQHASHSQSEEHPNGTADDSEDDAVPPPIKFKRDTVDENPLSPSSSPPWNAAYPPEVDELGYPTTPLPSAPIEDYSYRNIFSHINFIRILQKLTRRKTQRALMLINYKSSNHLKKSLKVPIHLLRYYTLKVFKSQVPFCGRKWRQGNMKIITAVWLSVPAELRDDWLSGGGGGMGGGGYGDVDGAAEDAVPMEQTLRALTHWWNVQWYREEMGMGRGLGGEEMGFFERELERMGLGGEEGGEMLEGEMQEPMTAAEWRGVGDGYPGMS
ncbi:Factor arrest protein 11 [Saxophila tyrrhenica]|uniref:Factor arrest protein 11 n=1 Tax=Saxophila tyrrhenica TaxID=1690608 RepID=A0AAV9PG95_9PEZI|nr:Factor arrest protein 11 [Saxophila tyrrhenica]